MSFELISNEHYDLGGEKVILPYPFGSCSLAWDN